MKKTISLMLCLLLIFSSISFAFAVDWSTTDQNNLQSIKNTLTNTTGGTIYYMISQINAAMRFSNKTIANWLSDIEAELSNTLWYVDGNTSRSITWWVKEAVLDLDQLVGTGSGTLLNYLQTLNSNVNTILTRTNSILTNLGNIDSMIAFIQGDTGNLVTDMTTLLGYQVGILGYAQNIESVISSSINNRSFMIWNSTNPSNNDWSTYDFRLNGNFTYSIPEALRLINYNTIYGLQKILNTGLLNYSSTQTAKNWLNLNNKTFTPSSAVNGIYTWLANIQEPIARLSYVHASDEEIAAREKSEANQTAVVNNFIDSSGSGAAPTSSFSDIASMSSGYISNMDTDASASGIWNIFNSNNFGWFSQETVNQLDTTVSTRKGSSDFETPILDQQISEIYKELGVDVND